MGRLASSLHLLGSSLVESRGRENMKLRIQTGDLTDQCVLSNQQAFTPLVGCWLDRSVDRGMAAE